MTFNIGLLITALLAIASIFWSTLRTGSSPVPTPASVRQAMLSLMPGHLPELKEPVVFELGSGWGGMAFALARRFPEQPVIGIEISILPWLFSRLRLLVQPQPNLHFYRKDFMHADLTHAALVVCYLLPGPMEKLARKLLMEMAPGGLVLSNTFAIRGWRPLDQITAPDLYRSEVYLYEIGNHQPD